MRAGFRSSITILALSACTTIVGAGIVPAHASDAETARLCRGDAFRFCLSEIPDRDRITACMVRNKARLSPGCQKVFSQLSQPATVETASSQR